MKILIDGQTLHTPEINRGIGRYFINVIENILIHNFSDQFFITIADESALSFFSEFARTKIRPIVNRKYAPNTSNLEDFSNTINRDISLFNIDIYWNPNPLMINVFLPEKKSEIKFAATIFDLIPLVMRKEFLDKWPENISKIYLSKLNTIKKDYDLLLHISENTKNDFIKNFKTTNINHEVTHLAVEDSYKPDPFPIIVSPEKYILFTGGFDPRKNMFRAIEAFSIFNLKLPKVDRFKLHIVCQLDQISTDLLKEHAKKFNCLDDLVLTGFISENDLITEYKKASAFFFPSLYEGFGLPILEALACGIPLACSDNSSIPEVGGKYAKYFNPYDVEDMAAKLLVVSKESHDLKKRNERYEYSKNFDWNKTAELTFGAFCSELKHKTRKSHKKKIAWLSPFPPQQSGISRYSEMITKELAKICDIDLFYDSVKPDENKLIFNKIHNIKYFRELSDQYDEVFYNIGNNPLFHTEIYKIAWEIPGTVILHDYNIQPFLEHAFLRGLEKKYFYKSLSEGYGISIDTIKKKTSHGIDPSFWKYSMSHALINRSKRTIVHSNWVREQFDKNLNIDVIPLFCEKIPEINLKELNKIRKKYNINENEYVVSILGFVNWNKHPEFSIDAVAKLIDHGYPVKLILAGQLSPELEKLTNNKNVLKYRENFIFTNYMSDSEYFNIIHLSDLIINLRFPSMGESSLTLMQAFTAKKPTIISGINQYGEYPDSICKKINHDEKTEVDQLALYIKDLITNESLRTDIKENLTEYSQQFYLGNLCRKYLSFI